MSSNGPLLDLRGLRTHFRTDRGPVRSVDGVDLSVAPGESVGVVGESGSGKSVTMLSVMRLLPSPPAMHQGQALWKGEDVFGWGARRLRSFRGREVAMIFQDPMTSLNPYLKIGVQLTEAVQLHLGLDHAKARDRAAEMLRRVGIPVPESRLDDYPHQYSGGMRQRVMIAMALSCEPQLLIADEPTTALDVTIQAQILELIDAQRRASGTGLVLITHSLGVVAGMCDRVVVMYAGRVVEEGRTEDLFGDPRMPYTVGLLRSVPRLDVVTERLVPVPGTPPDPQRLPSGCPFRVRCPWAEARCAETRPELRDVAAPGAAPHRIACHVDITKAAPREPASGGAA
ncbi:MAG: Oligopeptide transport ATP-binding protein OppD [Planctomycetes bacterium]|nr:Oligopeptide transport ATP-binding protein OppD [Planctomycetota bacterium]